MDHRFVIDQLTQETFGIIAQNCLSLAIDRCERMGRPLQDKRQRQTIKGAIRNALESHYADGDLQASDAMNELAAKTLEEL